MIKLIGLNKVYGKGSDAVHALRDVSLHVPQGKIFGVIGASGAGKSTLLDVIFGIREPQQGWVLDVLPPVAGTPGLGYVEWAGWVPGATPRLLVAREARSDGRTTRRFEVLALDGLAVDKSAGAPQLLAAFNGWADKGWRRASVSLR